VSRRLLVIGAHSADFVWRAGGAIAVTTAEGGAARVLALSYGERGESGELWTEPGQTVERVKEIRHGEAERAAAALGAEFACLDLGDYPLEVGRDALERIAERIREFEEKRRDLDETLAGLRRLEREAKERLDRALIEETKTQRSKNTNGKRDLHTS
jgi:LmbE family N-acetylglucosaminyl deacetylase